MTDLVKYWTVLMHKRTHCPRGMFSRSWMYGFVGSARRCSAVHYTMSTKFHFESIVLRAYAWKVWKHCSLDSFLYDFFFSLLSQGFRFRPNIYVSTNAQIKTKFVSRIRRDTCAARNSIFRSIDMHFIARYIYIFYVTPKRSLAHWSNLLNGLAFVCLATSRNTGQRLVRISAHRTPSLSATASDDRADGNGGVQHQTAQQQNATWNSRP